MNEELHKPFAIFQNDTTGQSWIWIENDMRWHEATSAEFEALQALAKYIRNSDNPIQLIKDSLDIADEDEKNDDIELF